MPAQRRGVTFEPALLAALLHDVTDRPGALPLLQYTLTELFESRRGDRITHAAYQQLGGISSALVKRADGLLSSLGDDADEVARQVFLRLITLTEGGEDTRRRVLLSELEDLDVDRRLLRSVLDTFGRHRLLSFDRDPLTRSPTVEISHEALLTEWTRLHDWIDGRATTSVPSGGSRRLSASGSPRTAPTHTSSEAAYSSSCRAGPARRHCSCPVQNARSSIPASPNAIVKRMRSCSARTELPLPSSANGVAVASSPVSVWWPYWSLCSACSERFSGVRRWTPSATSTTCCWSTVSSRHQRRNLPRTQSSPSCSQCSRCGRPSTSVTPPRRRSTQCTSRSRSSGSSTTSIREHGSRPDRDHRVPSACMPCHRTS